MMGHEISTIEELEAVYGEVSAPARVKELDYIHPHYRAYIEAAPFAVLATVGPEGTDCTPRGDPAGEFARVADEKTVLLPDRRGNNRVDSLRNIVRDPRVSLLFLIPGIDVTMQINGRSVISTDPDLIATFDMNGKLPRSVLVVTVGRIYFQCPKALVRSRLWSADAQVPRADLPSTGTMIKALVEDDFDAEAYDEGYPAHMARTIY